MATTDSILNSDNRNHPRAGLDTPDQLWQEFLDAEGDH
jgi:hypothetical protein